MKVSILALALASLLALPAAHAQNTATAEWIPESAEVAPGKDFRTVIRLKVDEGWHTYWENPGEGGLPIAVKAELPEGWTLGKIQFPAPIAFKTGPLSGFGYEGEVLFPLTISPPAGSDATALPSGIAPKITWLTCDDSACIPGKAQPTLSAPQPDLVEKAYAALPVPVPGAKVTLIDKGEFLQLRITLPPTWKVDISGVKVFPVTRNIIDPSAVISLGRDTDITPDWIATAPKSEYLDGIPAEFSLILIRTDGTAWKISTAPAPPEPGS